MPAKPQVHPSNAVEVLALSIDAFVVGPPPSDAGIDELRAYRKKALSNIERFLDAASEDQVADAPGDVFDLLDDVVGAVYTERRLRKRASRPPEPGPIEVGLYGDGGDSAGVIARTVRDLREAAGRSQEALSNDMRKLGFDWGREREARTVRDIEKGKRKVSLEEMIGFCILFEIPLGRFIAGGLRPHEQLRINGSKALAADSEALVLISQIRPLEDEQLDEWIEDPLFLLSPTTVEQVRHIMASVAGVDLLTRDEAGNAGPIDEATDWRPGVAIRAQRKKQWLTPNDLYVLRSATDQQDEPRQ